MVNAQRDPENGKSEVPRLKNDVKWLTRPLKALGFKVDDDTFMLILLLILYYIQTVPRVFYSITVPLVFFSQNIPAKQVSLLITSYVPLCFKFLAAPLLNTYYSKSFGRGKTYLVPVQYIYSIITIVSSYYVTQWFEAHNFTAFAIVSWVNMTLMMLQDIVLDGWIVHLIKLENNHIAATFHSIGSRIGFLVGWNMALSFSSVDFCNSYLYSTPRETPILSIENFTYYTGVIALVLNVLIHVFMKEKPVEEKEQQNNSLEVIIKSFKTFGTNAKLRNIMILFCTWNVCFGPIHSLLGPTVIEQGLSKETWSNINIPLIPLNIIAAIIAGNLCNKYPETRVLNGIWIIRLLSTIFTFFLTLYFKSLPNFLAVFGTFVAVTISNLTWNAIIVAFMAYAGRIAKETYGPSLMSAFGATSFVTRLLGDVFSYALIDVMGWLNLALLSLSITFFYAILFIPKVHQLEKMNSKEFMEAHERLD